MSLAERWPDNLVGPGETPETALLRRVKMHEFLMTGGIQIGTDKQTGRAVYSGPVDPSVTTECPWHPEISGTQSCAAWTEIVAGRGSGEAVMSPVPLLPKTARNSQQQMLATVGEQIPDEIIIDGEEQD